MSRPIDANATVNKIVFHTDIPTEYKEIVEDIITDMPTIEQEREIGRWIVDGHHIRCNQCGMSMCNTDREGDPIPRNFCPSCGRIMIEGE